MLLNLVTNAAQALDKPERVIVVTTRREGADAIAIEVADNGKGIAPEALPKIFDPFYTTKEVGKGTGLGLSIAYKIVSEHGGRIDVKSQPGKGTVFTVTLPFKPRADAAATGLSDADPGEDRQVRRPVDPRQGGDGARLPRLRSRHQAPGGAQGDRPRACSTPPTSNT